MIGMEHFQKLAPKRGRPLNLLLVLMIEAEKLKLELKLPPMIDRPSNFDF